jgi:outer membrane protein insertion porin family
MRNAARRSHASVALLACVTGFAAYLLSTAPALGQRDRASGGGRRSSAQHSRESRSEEGGETLAQVAIEGNQRVEEEAIRIHIKSRAGQVYDPERADADVRAIYAMGFFDDVTADLASGPDGPVLTFRVKERPFIASVKTEGNKALKKEDLEAALKIRPRTIYDPEKVRRGVIDAKRAYEEKGYLDVSITPEVEPTEGENEVDLTYKIVENKLIRIKKIVFEGNRKFSARQLRSVMATKQKWIFSFITSAGNLNRDVLKTDVERLTAFYYDNGYVNVKVDEPQIERKGDDLFVTIKVDEGEQYKVGDVRFTGDGVESAPPFDVASLTKEVDSKKGEVFRAGVLREDVAKLTDLYGDKGFAFANVEPDTEIRSEEKVVDIDFRVSKGRAVTIDQVQITGNTKTRDKVIRREMRIGEQEEFSATKLKKSRDALQRLGFFQDVNVTTRKAQSPDQINVLVDVKEGSTGAFSAGAGFSSGDNLLFNVRISENNVFGRGQRIVLNADFGKIRRNFYVAYTEPYLFDTRLAGTGTLFNTQLDFQNFTRESLGFSLRALYPLEDLGLTRIGPLSLEDTRIGFEYRYEKARIFDISFDAPPSIFAEQGRTTISSISPNFTRNTLNHAFDPTAGSYQDVSVEFAGLGGDSDFIRAEARGRWFYPVYRTRSIGTFVYSIGGTVAYGRGDAGLSGKELPLVERYFPGGINTVRGFQTRSLGPRENTFDPQGNIINNDPIGGTNELIVQNEFIFPIVQQLGLRGVVFFDLGNAFLEADGIDIGQLRYAAGAGVRWLSPFGPLRIEFGVPINAKSDDKKSAVLFSFGAPL